MGRERGQRKALFKSLLCSLVKHGKIKTTEAKAKEMRSKIEKMVTTARTNSLSSRRLLAEYLPKDAVKKMLEEIGPKYIGRSGGYTRIIKMGCRKGDGSPMAIIEFV